MLVVTCGSALAIIDRLRRELRQLTSATLPSELMKRILFSALSLLIASHSLAASAEFTAGAKDCLVFHNKKAVGITAKWTGPCKDGYADGEGKLQWSRLGKVESSYEGPMQRGRYHGVGYTSSVTNEQYEGHFVEGEREGFGIAVSEIGDRYDGHWKAGQMEGTGKMVYALGGSYEGEWRGGQMHGKGTIVYAGGRRAEYQFVNGHWPEAPDYPDFKKLRRYSLKSYEAETGSKFKNDELVGGYVPYELSYAKMSPEQKKIVAAGYPLMDMADEPPYPLNGVQTISRMIVDLYNKIDVSGTLRLFVKVGPDGKAMSVTSIGSPSDQMTKFASHVVMLEKYKPGMCAGKPCTMIYPFSLEFGVLN